MLTVLPGLGDFVVSPGFGGLAAVIAAVIAFRAATSRIRVDRELARQELDADRAASATADARQRWWEALLWAWENYRFLGADITVNLLSALKNEAHTVEQKAVLTAVVEALVAQTEVPQTQASETQTVPRPDGTEDP